MIPPHLQGYQLTETLFIQAMTHRSYLNEKPSKISNERLEFLGDAIIKYLISEELYNRFPDQPEGVLTALRSQLVQTKTFSMISQNLKLGQYLFLAKGEETTGGRTDPSLLENAFEALAGAVYLSGGLPAALKLLNDHLFPHIAQLSLDKLKDPKSNFQELIQAQGLPTPYYQVVSAEGPDHDKLFTIEVYVGTQQWGQGSGKSKQQAQQLAAQAALDKWHQSL